MSSYSFSNEFYQHWTGAPEPVRAAIVQELEDITALLHNETSFEDFAFSNHDLDTHLDDLYGAHYQQQAAAKDQADKQAADIALADKQRLEDERLQADKKIAEEKADAKKKQDEADKEAVAKANEKLNAVSEKHISDIKAVNSDSDTKQTITLALQDKELTSAHQDMLHELEVHIDDYLTEQMLQMSENLKSWLRAEISRQLGEKTQTTDDPSEN